MRLREEVSNIITSIIAMEADLEALQDCLSRLQP